MREVTFIPSFRTIAAAAIVSASALSGAGAQAATPARAAETAQSAQSAAPPQTTAPQATAAQTTSDAAAPAARRLLPDVAIVGRDGTATTTAQALPSAGQWLLLHVKRGSVPCETLLGRLQGPGWEQAPAHITIVVSGSTAEEMADMARRFPSLDAARWYADQPGALAAALGIQEIPSILGMNQRGIQWTLAGVLAESKRMQQVLTGWVGIEQVPQNQASPR